MCWKVARLRIDTKGCLIYTFDFSFNERCLHDLRLLPPLGKVLIQFWFLAKIWSHTTIGPVMFRCTWYTCSVLRKISSGKDVLRNKIYNANAKHRKYVEYNTYLRNACRTWNITFICSRHALVLPQRKKIYKTMLSKNLMIYFILYNVN